MNHFNADKFNKLTERFPSESLKQYFHELVDSWLLREKLSYIKYYNFVDLENWWQLEKQIELASRLFLNSESEEQVCFATVKRYFLDPWLFFFFHFYSFSFFHIFFSI